MARPRKDQEGPSARERMEEAFWELLAERPYASITVSDIVRRARVNRNVFYYHFQNIDDMARTLVASTLDEELPRFLARGIESGRNPITVVFESEMFQERFQRLWSVVGSHGSPELIGLLKGAVREAWCRSFLIDPQHLAPETSAAMEFVLGGIIAVLQKRLSDPNDASMEAFVASDIVEDMFAVMMGVVRAEAERQEEAGVRPKGEGVSLAF